MAAGIDEANADAPTERLKGRYINLFQDDQPILIDPEIKPGKRLLLIDLDLETKKGQPHVVSAACRVQNEKSNDGNVTFTVTGNAESRAVVRIVMAHAPSAVFIDSKIVRKDTWDFADDCLRLKFVNKPEPQDILIKR